MILEQQLYECEFGSEVKPRRRFMQGHIGKKDFLSSEDAGEVVRSLGIKNGLKYG
jgi:hypothetical protein